MSRTRSRTEKATRIADVARLAGVSTATVSRVLANPGMVRPKTHALVMAAVRRSGYTPNSTARNLRTQRTMMILAVVPNLANPVFAQILRGIDDALSESGYGIVIGNLDNRQEREARYVDLALSRRIDGVLLMSGRIPADGRRSMGEAALPMVALCAAVPGAAMPSVTVEDREAAQAAVAHLVRLGHRRLGYVSGPPGNVIEGERYAGFRKGAAAAGLSEADLVRWEGRFVFAAGVAAAEAFLRLRRRPTGIFAACDESAVAFVKTVRAAGLRVPEDVSVIGFDGSEFADYAEPTLTTLRQPLQALGRAGAEAILKLIRNELSPAEWRVRLPVTLLDRDTTGPAPQETYEAVRKRAG